ncbi:MAG: HD domain-containing protein [Gemmatimonadetes bacterium]|nr:HD domain-containing protein [Gemmatimonadota bacterium]
MTTERLKRQLDFIVELDKLKRILRQTLVMDGSRQENSAEHSWHLAVMAVLLHEHAGDAVDVQRVLRMLLIHDVVEIDAGDTFCYDAAASVGKEERERRAAERLFGLLPGEQAQEFRDLWEEFEARETADAQFANALDRLQGLLQNYHNAGGTWRLHGITRDQVLNRMRPIQNASPELWKYVLQVIDEVYADSDLIASTGDGKD